MERAIQLAHSGLGYTQTNPLVGAVLVDQHGKTIGEGWHRAFGESHAEIHAINQVKDKSRIHQSTLYVTLEPCNHHGKTPPCTDTIIQNKIKRVVIGMQDPFALVNGAGINRLIEHGVHVDVGVCENACKILNKRFIFNQKTRLPFVVLKWAQSLNGIAGSGDIPDTLKGRISSSISRRRVHQWRSEEQAVLIGYKTFISDQPKLSVDYGFRAQPIKLLLDPYRETEKSNELEKLQEWTILKTSVSESGPNYIHTILSELFERGISSLLVEGGPATHHKFIESGLWNECRVIISNQTIRGKVKAAAIPSGIICSDETCKISGDRIITITNPTL